MGKVAKVTDKDFRAAVTEACRRYHDAAQRWARFKVHLAPPVMEKDLQKHQRLWNDMQDAKEQIPLFATGLLGLLQAPDLNERAKQMLPELLEAAAKRQRRLRNK